MQNLQALPIEWIIFVVSVLLLFSVLASKASGRVGVPALLVFLAVGMLAGSDGPGGIYFDNPWMTQFLGSLALAFILFDGGLQTRWSSVRPILRPALSMATLGVALTAGAVAAFLHFVLGFPWLNGLLIGSIISSTDAAAVFSILRSRGTRLREPLEPLLELESGSNDPMAIFQTIGFTGILANPGLSALSLLPVFFLQFGVGGAAGWALGKLTVRLLNRINLREEGLYPALTTAAMLLIFGLTTLLRGSGFLAVYIAGLVLAQSSFVHKRSLGSFHNGSAWLMQIIMFLVLGLQVFPSHLPSVAGTGLLVAGFLALVSRPLSVFISLIPFRFSVREKLLVSWVGLRGAVPIVLTTFPLLSGVAEADTIFHIIFFVVLVSVLIQGTTITLAAKLLGLTHIPAPGTREPLITSFQSEYEGHLIEFDLLQNWPGSGRRVMDLGLPDSALLVVVERSGRFLVPRGDLTLQGGDRVLVAVDAEGEDRVQQIFATKKIPIRM